MPQGRPRRRPLITIRARPAGRHSNNHDHAAAPARSRLAALVAAPLVTLLAVGSGVVLSGSTPVEATSADMGTAAGATLSSTLSSTPPTTSAVEKRTLGTSRSSQRVALVDNRVPKAKGKLWSTAPLNIRVEPREKSKVAGLVSPGKHLPVTGREKGGYAEVIVNRVARWVTADYLSKDKEVQPGSKGLVDRSCPGTEGTESGLTSSAVRVYRAVCNNFPQITTYGGYDGHGEHASGRAIDIMTSDSGLGTQIAEFLRANAGALNLYDVIWQQRIWTPVRSGEGWRSMPSRGSATANHFDHVHVSVN